MSRTKSILLAVPVLAFALTPAGYAGWFHNANDVRTPDGNLVHDSEMVQMSVVATDMAESSWVCLFYERDSSKVKQGRVKTTARYLLDGEQIREVDFVGGVTQNRILNCKRGPAAPVGTVVEFSHEFLGMPRVFGKKGEYVEVSGVVGDEILQPVVASEIARFALTPADEDSRGRINSASSIFVADKASQRHPVALSQTAITSRALTNPNLCVSYRRGAEAKPSKGRFTSTATVTYPNGDTERLNFAAGVSQHKAVRCKEISRDVPVGTVIESDVRFLGMPRLRGSEASPEHIVFNTSLSTAGNVDFRQPPPPVVETPPDDDGGDGGGTPPPPTGGGLSAADRTCISRVLFSGGGNSRQIVRPKGNKGGKFEVFGPRSTVSNGKANPATLGFGPTYAAACTDYERKRGPLPAPGAALTSRDVNNFVWYGNMNSSAGPTAVRRDPRGGFHGDWWRPWTGVVIVNASSASGAIELMRRAGL